MTPNSDYASIIQEKCYINSGAINSHTHKQSWWETNKLLHIYDDIMKFTDFLPIESSMKQRLFHYLSDIPSVPICKRDDCIHTVNWCKTQYLGYCSTKCSSTDTLEKRKQTSMDRYGVDNPSKSSEIIQKIKDNTFVKYGVTNYSLTDDFKTHMKSLWNDNKEQWLNDREIHNMETHGWKNPFEDTKVLQKTKDTMIVKYGTEHALQVPAFLDRAIATNITRYGAKNFLQKDIDPEFVNNRNDVDWIKSQMQTMSVKQMSVKFNLSRLSIGMAIKKVGISLASYSGNETEIYNYIKEIYGGEIDRTIRTILKDGKELDIYIPDMKLAIEHNGMYWHQERKGKHRTYHLNKTKECNENGIQLLHIFEEEWDDKKDIVKSIIASKFGINEKIYARKCKIQTVNKDDEKLFLEANHIQGYIPSKVCLGLYYNNELVQVMSFGKPRFSKKYNTELLRLATLLYKNVIGGAQKLIKHYIKTYEPDSIISYCDLRLFTGDVYNKMNFQFSHNSDPGYYYVDQYGKTYNRLQFQKSKLEKKLKTYDPTLTADANMINNGFHKIWDCGNGVWTMILKRQD